MLGINEFLGHASDQALGARTIICGPITHPAKAKVTKAQCRRCRHYGEQRTGKIRSDVGEVRMVPTPTGCAGPAAAQREIVAGIPARFEARLQINF
jgi:hypothetical protein